MQYDSFFRSAACLAVLSALSFSIAAQSEELPVSRIALFSSGVGYFEHAGRVTGDARISIPFHADEVDDVLKSLAVRSGAGGESPSVSYPSLEDESRALKAFRIDLSGAPGTAELLSRLVGVSLDVRLGGADGRRFAGRVLGVESRYADDGEAAGGVRRSLPFANFMTDRGWESIPLDSIVSFTPSDASLAADMGKAIDYLAASRDHTRTTLDLRLPGSGTRPVSFGYVVAAPVWKASYRLDLSGESPYLQGWAVVDNSTDRDWRGVTLSLVSGRPSSFIQRLYAPLYVDRPVVPLAIAGSAEPRMYGQGLADAEEYSADEVLSSRSAPVPAAAPMEYSMAAKAAAPRAEASGGSAASDLGASSFNTAASRAAGDQFEFTLPGAVSLDRGSSALLPLVAGALEGERVSIYSPGMDRPALGARIRNSTGMKLPAGPVTVFDGGSYAGDALMDFLNEKDERLISFGEDLALAVAVRRSDSRETVAVNVSKGVLVFSRQRSVAAEYECRNGAVRDRTLIVEHPETSGAELASPTSFLERADGRYRFKLTVPAGKQSKLIVVEKSPILETVSLSPLGSDSFLRYSSSAEIPPAVKAALAKAAELKRAAEDAARAVRDLQDRRAELAKEQGRIRDNLTSLGRETAEGKKYVSRLLDAETELDRNAKKIEDTKKAQQAAQAAFESYLGNLAI